MGPPAAFTEYEDTRAFPVPLFFKTGSFVIEWKDNVHFSFILMDLQITPRKKV